MNADELEVLMASREFARNQEGYDSGAPVAVWLEVIRRRPDLRFGLCHYQRHPPEIFAVLARDENRRVRWAVSLNASTPVEVLAELARDADEEIRLRVAKHKKTPADVLELLASDSAERVAERARQRLVAVAAEDGGEAG